MALTTSGLRFIARPGHPDFLDLPWQKPLSAWDHERLVEVTRGLHRHVVRFVDYDSALYALKELPRHLAEREYRLLRHMAEQGLPVVDVAGVVHRGNRNGAEIDDVLVTRYLDYSLPYRTLFMHRRRDDVIGEVRGLSERLLDALAVLLVRLHLAGFFWGDCSLSNTLFRRDAGALAAYLVDAETGEWHPHLTNGQRELDLQVTEENVAGGLMDLQAEFDLPPEPDPVEVAEDLRARYDQLWTELTNPVVIGPDERYRVQARMRRMNELGFDVDEVELVATEDGDRLQLRTVVTEQGHHRRRLLSLTGLRAQENQARSLLNDLANFRGSIERASGRSLPESVAAHRWLSEVFEPTVAAIPEQLHGRREAAEVFHEVIEHKWFLSELAGHDVGVEEAVASYVDRVLPEAPQERRVITDEDAEGYMGLG